MLPVEFFTLRRRNRVTRLGQRARADIASFIRSPNRILSGAGEFPLYETAAAHMSVEAGGKVGTVVVTGSR